MNRGDLAGVGRDGTVGGARDGADAARGRRGPRRNNQGRIDGQGAGPGLSTVPARRSSAQRWEPVWSSSAAGWGIGRIGGSAADSIARQPEASGSITGVALITAAMIEGATLFAVVVCLLGMLWGKALP